MRTCSNKKTGAEGRKPVPYKPLILFNFLFIQRLDESIPTTSFQRKLESSA
jgi:hypothetical protein